ncbi:MAG TPA: deaminase [Candidatus Saccharimonadales bacterium]|nr:deaminase [Candidatus Saccharimonadales bacterium]
MSDKDYLKLAINEGNKKPAPYNYGAAVVCGGKVLALEHGHVQETGNPTLHAEISAIIKACKKLGNHNIPGAVLYASHEPCMMCLACAAWAEVSRIVYATPASEQADVMYEFKDFSAADFAKKVPRPLRVERLKI